MKKIKDMYMWELEEIVKHFNTLTLHAGYRFEIDKPHNELLFYTSNENDYDAYFTIDIVEKTFTELIMYMELDINDDIIESINDYMQELFD